MYGAEPGKASFRQQLPAGPAAGRARRAVRAALPSRLGPSRRPAQRAEAAVRHCDQGSAALVKDLKQRGLLDDTLVIWGGEFGRTAYSQGAISKDNFGRDHHPRCFTIWMAGGGIKPGITLRQDRRLRLQRRRRRRPRPRFPGDDPALAGHRPQEADLSLSKAATSA